MDCSQKKKACWVPNSGRPNLGQQKIVKCKEADGVGVMILSGGMCIQCVKKKQRNKCFNPYRNFRKSPVNKRHTKMSKLQFNCMIYLFKKRAFN